MGDTAPSRRIEPGDWGMHADPRQLADLMRPSFASGGVVNRKPDDGDLVPALLDPGFIVPRCMAERLHRKRTGLGWPGI